MARLSKQEIRQHMAAMSVLQNDILTDEEREFVFRHWLETANHINSRAGAFFTPLDLAWDVALDVGLDCSQGEVAAIDLCAGIGVLSYCLARRVPGVRLVCVEINPDYVAIGKKLVPEAEWHCMDVTDVEKLKSLGHFQAAIGNPPFGRVASFNGKRTPRYQGGEAEYKVIDLAAEVAKWGVFVLPQESVPFRYSGVQSFEERTSDKYQKFTDDTGLTLELGLAIDTSVYEGWKGVCPKVEIANVNFAERAVGHTQDIWAA